MTKEDGNKVKIRLFGNLRRKYKDCHDTTLNVKDGSKVTTLLENCGIPEEEAKLIMVNGTDKKKDYTLKDGDTISIFPIVMGG